MRKMYNIHALASLIVYCNLGVRTILLQGFSCEPTLMNIPGHIHTRVWFFGSFFFLLRYRSTPGLLGYLSGDHGGDYDDGLMCY